MDLAAAATKHYGNMTGRYSWSAQRADNMMGCKGKKKKKKNIKSCYLKKID